MLGNGWPKLITAVAFFSTRSGRNARYGRDSFAVEALRRQFSKRVWRRAPGGSVGWPGGWWVRAPDDGRVVGVWSASSPGRGRDGLSLTALRVLGFFSGGRHLQPTQNILPYIIQICIPSEIGQVMSFQTSETLDDGLGAARTPWGGQKSVHLPAESVEI